MKLLIRRELIVSYQCLSGEIRGEPETADRRRIISPRPAGGERGGEGSQLMIICTLRARTRFMLLPCKSKKMMKKESRDRLDEAPPRDTTSKKGEDCLKSMNRT